MADSNGDRQFELKSSQRNRVHDSLEKGKLAISAGQL